MLEITLEKLGLSEKEAKVYLAALELAQESVQNIAQKAGVNRPTAYVILEKLMKLGLISTITKGKKTLFIAENPKELKSILAKQQQELDDKKRELDDNLNQFLAIFNSREDKPTVRFYEGVDGLESLERFGQKMMKKNDETLTIAPVDLAEKYFQKTRKSSVEERVKLGIRSRVIYTNSDGQFSDEQNEEELREAIFLPRTELPLDTIIAIYPNWAIKLFYLNPERPYGVLIESKEIARNMKYFFELAWLGAKASKK